MNYWKTGAVILLIAGTASCASSGPLSYSSNDLITTDQYYGVHPVELVTVDDYRAQSSALRPDPNRKVSEEDCTRPFTFDGDNLRCK
jgi:hypothetical protein